MLVLDYFGFGDTTNITTGANTHPHTHTLDSSRAVCLAVGSRDVLAHYDRTLRSIYDKSPLIVTNNF